METIFCALTQKLNNDLLTVVFEGFALLQLIKLLPNTNKEPALKADFLFTLKKVWLESMLINRK